MTSHTDTYADVTPTTAWIDTPDGPVQGPVTGYDEVTEDADDNRPVIVAALAALGWEPVTDEEWLHVEGGLGSEQGCTRIHVQPVR